MFTLHEERGQGLVEYALILAFIALVVIVIIGVFGGSVANYYSRVTNSMP